MQCPACKQAIDDDSLYCDQCGAGILVCTRCGRPGKGKRCIFDGSPLAKPGSGGAPTDTIRPEPEGAPAPGSSTPPAAQAAGGAPAAPLGASPGALRLVSVVRGIDIRPADGDVIGRKKGSFAQVFGSLGQVSGAHLQLSRTVSGWTVQDLGSTNGTSYNGARLVPNTPCPVASGGVLRVADIDLAVTVEGGGATTRI